MHTHLLVWIDVKEELIHEIDKVHIPEGLEVDYHLMVTDKNTGEKTRLYDPKLVNYANANIWALKEVKNLSQKLRIVPQDREQLISYGRTFFC